MASVYRSLQCLINVPTQAVEGGLPFRLLIPSGCREGGALLSPSMLLRLPAALYGACPALRAVPVFEYSTKVRTRLRLRFVPSPARAAQAARSSMGALSLGAVRLLPSAAQPQFPPALVGRAP